MLANKVFIPLCHRASDFQIFLSAAPSEPSLPVLVTSHRRSHLAGSAALFRGELLKRREREIAANVKSKDVLARP